MIRAREITNDRLWLEWRREFVGASEIAAVFEMHPYKSKLELWAEKCGLLGAGAETSVMRRGKILESAVAVAAGIERPQWRLIKCDRYYSDDEIHIGCSPDYMIFDDPRGVGVLQCKTANPQSFEENFAAESAPPFWIALQTATEVMMTDAAFGAIAVLLVDAWREPVVRLFDVPRDHEAEIKLKEGCREFWEESVKTGKRPTPNPDRDRRLLPKIMTQEAPGLEIDLSHDNELPGLLDMRLAAKETAKIAEAQCDRVEAMVMERMGANERALLPDGWRATWRIEPRRGYTVADSKPRVLRLLKPKKGFGK
jgi:predicted phage-related endonuclease